MRTSACALLLFLAGPVAADEVVVRELTEARIDLYFSDDGAAALPPTLTYRLVDDETRVELLPETTVTPSELPCPGNPPGCVRLTIPAAQMLIVGLCRGSGVERTPATHCRTAADCPSHAPCNASTGGFQNHSLVIQWPDAHDTITLRTLNLPHVFPPTLTPTQTPTQTPTATASQTPTQTHTETPTPE